jgi:Asp-tRNAAsn/Glu-tRNAGln amidotransferase A subunit and related amidases
MTTQDKIRNIATKVGMDLDEEAMLDYAAASEELAEQSSAFESQTPESTAATDVESGDDDYNAVRYRFTLSGDADGPLAGLSVGVKDNLAVAGVPMHCGSAALSFTPNYHATVVDRLLGVGGAVEATTNMDEFAYFTTGETCAFGTIENPVTDGVPGGSSSGSAAAVAAGTLDAALGSDTGGSVRIPAAHCGVVGLKPTHRAVPRFGLADLAPSLDCIGPLGRRCRDRRASV